MSCEVTGGSPFNDPSFDNGWMKVESPSNGGGGLEAVAEFNATFDAGLAHGTVDPRFAFDNTPSPITTQYNNAGFDHHTPNTEQSTFNPYPSSFGGQAPNAPYFQSVENSPAPVYQASSIRSSYRRSVSEPPGAIPMQQQQQAPVMTFHRENHYLGKPLPLKAVPLKSLPKSKQARQHPYSRKMEQQQQHYFRPEHRRAHTQPIGGGPTSAPYHIMQPQYFQQPMTQNSQLLNSRICVPPPPGAVMPQPVDPMINAMQPRTPQTKKSDPKSVVSIPMTVDELRTMIFDAVQKAMDDAWSKRDSEPSNIGVIDLEQGVTEEPVIPHEVEEGVPDEYVQ